jgi:hypothetical protein
MYCGSGDQAAAHACKGCQHWAASGAATHSHTDVLPSGALAACDSPQALACVNPVSSGMLPAYSLPSSTCLHDAALGCCCMRPGSWPTCPMPCQYSTGPCLTRCLWPQALAPPCLVLPLAQHSRMQLSRPLRRPHCAMQQGRSQQCDDPNPNQYLILKIWVRLCVSQGTSPTPTWVGAAARAAQCQPGAGQAAGKDYTMPVQAWMHVAPPVRVQGASPAPAQFGAAARLLDATDLAWLLALRQCSPGYPRAT